MNPRRHLAVSRGKRAGEEWCDSPERRAHFSHPSLPMPKPVKTPPRPKCPECGEESCYHCWECRSDLSSRGHAVSCSEFFRNRPKKPCVACGGSGISSAGTPCVPCLFRGTNLG